MLQKCRCHLEGEDAAKRRGRARREALERLCHNPLLRTPKRADALRAPPATNRQLLAVRRTVHGGVVCGFGWRALRPPRVVFVIRLCVLIIPLTAKQPKQCTNLVNPVTSVGVSVCSLSVSTHQVPYFVAFLSLTKINYILTTTNYILATELVCTRISSIQVHAGPDLDRPKRTRTANMTCISDQRASRRTTPGDTVYHGSAQSAGSAEHTELTVCVCRRVRIAPNCRRPARTCFSERETSKGGSDIIDCLPT